MFFRIQKRLASSNIIERSLDGKTNWTPFIAPLCKKSEGDKICEEFMNHRATLDKVLEPYYQRGFTSTADKVRKKLKSMITIFGK